MKCFSIIALSLAAVAAGWAQAPTKSRTAGTVTSVDPQAHHIVIKTEKGDPMTLTVNERTFLLHMAPGETDPKKATKITLTDIVIGDKLAASGIESPDHKAMDATTVAIMTQADVSEIHKKEEEDWQKRGTAGIVSSVDPAAKTFAMKVGTREVTVDASDKTLIRRYSPDSAKGADATPSTFAEIKTGDQARVLGNKSPTGDRIEAEQVLTGTFRQIAAVVEAYDPQTHELRVKDLDNKKTPTLFIKVNSDSQLNKLPPEMAAMLARRFQGARGGQGRGGPGGPGGAGAEAGGRQGRGGRGGDMAQMLDHLPPMPVTDLKKGDAIMVLTTAGSDPTKVTAIRLLAGVEDLLTSPAGRDIMSGWNLGGGGGGEGN